MSENTGPVYEVTHRVDPLIIDAFDAWLVAHVEEMLEIPGFVSARVYTAEDGEDGRKKRVTQYFLDSVTDLDHYLAGPADHMRQSAVQEFGEQIEARRRVLHHSDVHNGALRPLETCLNCDSVLSGQYCGNCGQRAHSRLISIWELVRDAFGDLFELDSRVWRTLIPLIRNPGQLTRDYLEGRRVRFMPPFRTYLVLSILFFLIAFFDPREELGILFEPEPDTAAESAIDDREADSIREELLRELEDEGIINAEEAETAADSDNEVSISVGGEEGDEACDFDDLENADIPEFLASRLTPERMVAICNRMVADDGKAFLTRLLDNVPAALFILLPLMALVLKILYPMSKRYYVEHLLFVVHFHAFFFLILILQILFTRLIDALSLPNEINNVTVFATSLYIPVYLYKSMRRVYEQGHLVTLPKFALLVAAYLIGISIIFFFAALLAAFAI